MSREYSRKSSGETPMAVKKRPPAKQTTVVIKVGELAVAFAVMAVLAVAVFVLVVGSTDLGTAPAVPLDVISTSTSVVPGAGQPTTEASDVAEQVPTSVIAPTGEPVPPTVNHRVKPGETLLGIAALYGVDMQAILDANGLNTDSVLIEGQVIIIPLLPGSEGVWHEVQPGETLLIIAELYGVTPELIQAANNITDPDSIYVGQRLRIPNAVTPTPTPTPTPTATPTPTVTPTSLFTDTPTPTSGNPGTGTPAGTPPTGVVPTDVWPTDSATWEPTPIPGMPTSPADGDFRADSPDLVAATGRPQLLEFYRED